MTPVLCCSKAATLPYNINGWGKTFCSGYFFRSNFPGPLFRVTFFPVFFFFGGGGDFMSGYFSARYFLTYFFYVTFFLEKKVSTFFSGIFSAHRI